MTDEDLDLIESRWRQLLRKLTHPDAESITHLRSLIEKQARDDVPKLIKEVKRLRQERLERLRTTPPREE